MGLTADGRLFKTDRATDVNKRKIVFFFKCLVSDIDVKENRTWKYPERHCVSCQNIAIDKTGLHILEGKIIIGQNYRKKSTCRP